MNGHAIPIRRNVLVYLVEETYPPCHLLALIGNSSWVKTCHQAECATPQEGTEAMAKPFPGGEKIKDLEQIVVNALTHAETQSNSRYQMAAVTIPIPRERNQWNQMMYAHLVAGIEAYLDRYRDPCVLSVTFVFPPNSTYEIDDFARFLKDH